MSTIERQTRERLRFESAAVINPNSTNCRDAESIIVFLARIAMSGGVEAFSSGTAPLVSSLARNLKMIACPSASGWPSTGK